MGKNQPSSRTIRITANGCLHEIVAPCTVTEFLTSRNLKPTQVVVEYNGEALLRDQFKKVQLQDGDHMEVVLPVAGG